MGNSGGFHGHTDTNNYPVQSDSNVAVLKKENFKREWALSYRFYPHFHPYVSELIKKLVQGSIQELQATDTEYTPYKDGTLPVQPDSTIVSVESDVKAIGAGGEVETIPKGTQIFLPDGTMIKLDNGKTVTLPGTMIVEAPRGMRFTTPDGSTVDVSIGDEFTLNSETSVRLSQGRTLIDLPANTKVILQSCKPMPDFFSNFFALNYDPSSLVERPYPVKDLDFSSGGAYSVYNWELFYHLPLTIALQLSKNQRFEEAQKWLHCIFDPTDDSTGPTPERFWKVKPFQYTDVKKIEEILVNLSYGADPALWQDTVNSIEAWKDAPFRPHLVARYRQTAYMIKTVTAYFDNLISWGDSLFRVDTGESINEATQIYVLAANILGPRPQAIPKKGSVRPKSYGEIRENLSELGDIMVKLETDIPFDNAPALPSDSVDNARLGTLSSVGNTLYFCVPRNDKLMSYWDTVADRLFKIRNSLNIQGIFRQLPLFEPPIDPALLAKAVAAGLDVSAVISGLNQPLPLVRFQFLIQKASEICQEVKSLGSNLLSAMEKEDNEMLAILRARHERVILVMAETVKFAQLQEAIKAREGLEKSRDNAVQRYTYYERLLGKTEEEIKEKIPELGELNIEALEKMGTFSVSEPEVEQGPIEVDIAQDLSGEGGGKKMNTQEVEEMSNLKDARSDLDTASDIDKVGATLAIIPSFSAKFQPFGTGGSISFGGSNLAGVQTLISSFYRSSAEGFTYKAANAAKIGGYTRREQDWALQGNLAAMDITLTFKQLRAAQIREASSNMELKNHKVQIKFAEEIERFLTDEKNGKKTNQSFYTWMKREVKGLYSQCFQFAFDIAKKAERALQHELGDPTLTFLQFGYLAGKEGLLAGEKLYLDIRRMEMAYHELNQREYELTKHISLSQLDPLALTQLRQTGKCIISVREEVFDMDCPSHYFRRIKTAAVSIPSVTGPYTSVNCTLTLLKSSIRKTPLLRDGQYTREGPEDDRFSDHFGSMQSIVTSTAQNDSGMFETNLRDERYLPFEGSGVISEWQIELPRDFKQFDYDTISDVVLHVRYTAREGGGVLRNAAVLNLETQIKEAQAAGLVRLFSIRHEFPNEWAMFKNTKEVSSDKPAKLMLDLKLEHYPFWSKDSLEAIKRLELFAETTVSVEVSLKVDANGKLDNTKKITLARSLGKLKTGVMAKAADSLTPIGSLALYFGNNSMEDLWLALTWGKKE